MNWLWFANGRFRKNVTGEKESFMDFNVFSIVCTIGLNKWQIQIRWVVIWLKFIMHLAMHIYRGQ